MPILRQIAQLGHPVLRQHAQVVASPAPSFIQPLIEDLLVTVADVGGVGIAAPQVYESIRLFVVASRPTPRYPSAPRMEPVAMINPELAWRSEETEKAWEGCLSVPGIRGMVPRSARIRVRYLTSGGELHEEEYVGFLARIFQHELDHLDGLVFLDRVENTREIVTEREYQRILAREDAR